MKAAEPVVCPFPRSHLWEAVPCMIRKPRFKNAPSSVWRGGDYCPLSPFTLGWGRFSLSTSHKYSSGPNYVVGCATTIKLIYCFKGRRKKRSEGRCDERTNEPHLLKSGESLSLSPSLGQSKHMVQKTKMGRMEIGAVPYHPSLLDHTANWLP